MAKEDIADELPDGEEVAEAVEPSKKKTKAPKPKKDGDIPIVLIVGGALGGVVLIILSVVIGTVVANKLFPPYVEGIETAIKEVYANMVAKEEATNDNKKLPFPDEDTGFEDSQLLTADADWHTFTSGEVTTNTKNSTTMFGIVSIAVDYSLHYKEELIARGFATVAGKDAPIEIDDKSQIYQRFQLAVTSVINDFIGSHTSEELQSMRQELGAKIREELKPTFRSFGLVIGNVKITKFIVARA